MPTIKGKASMVSLAVLGRKRNLAAQHKDSEGGMEQCLWLLWESKPNMSYDK